MGPLPVFRTEAPSFERRTQPVKSRAFVAVEEHVFQFFVNRGLDLQENNG